MQPNKQKLASSKTAYLYARELSQAKAKGDGTEAQLATLHSYALGNGFKVLGEFVDVGLKKKSTRPGFKDLKTSLAKQSKDKPVIIVLDMNRLVRNHSDWLEISDLNVPIHVVNDKKVFSRESSPEDRLLHGFRVLLANHLKSN